MIVETTITEELQAWIAESACMYHRDSQSDCDGFQPGRHSRLTWYRADDDVWCQSAVNEFRKEMQI